MTKYTFSLPFAEENVKSYSFLLLKDYLEKIKNIFKLKKKYDMILINNNLSLSISNAN